MTHSTRTRVTEHTDRSINARIERETKSRINYYAQNPKEIEDRLRELDQEWDIERTLEVNSSALSLLGLAMGLIVNRRWLLLPLAVQAFFMQHALQGWCPPLPLLRQQGFRTQDEINCERYSLKLLRGDFQGIDVTSDIRGSDSAQIFDAITH